MKLNKNKQMPVGMLFLVLAIIFPKIINVSDMITGMLYGLAIGVLMMGIFNNKK